MVSENFAMIPLWVCPKLGTHAEWAVLMALLNKAAFDHDQQRWIAWPSATTIADLTGQAISTRSVWNGLNRLEETGLIVKVPYDVIEWEVIPYAHKSNVYVLQPGVVAKSTYQDELVFETKVPFVLPVNDLAVNDLAHSTVQDLSHPPMQTLAHNKSIQKEHLTRVTSIVDSADAEPTQQDPETAIRELTTEAVAALNMTQRSKALPTGSKLPKKPGGRYIYPAAIEELIAAYPARDTHKPNKKNVYEKWRALVVRGVGPNELLTAAGNYKQEWQQRGANPQYVKGLDKFLREDMWEQYLEVVVEDPKLVNVLRIIGRATGRNFEANPQQRNDFEQVARTFIDWELSDGTILKGSRHVASTLSGFSYGAEAFLRNWPAQYTPKSSQKPPEAAGDVGSCTRACETCSLSFDPDKKYSNPLCSKETFKQAGRQCGMLKVLPPRWRAAADEIEEARV